MRCGVPASEAESIMQLPCERHKPGTEKLADFKLGGNFGFYFEKDGLLW
jgi:hypothetical protein